MEKVIIELGKRIDEHEKRIKSLEGLFKKSDKRPIKKRISAREFLSDVNPKGNVQKTTTFGFFLENERGYNCFNVKDILSIFREAKEVPPNNPSDIINKGIRKNWIMEHSEKKDDSKAYVLTNTGEMVVKNKFVKEK